MHPLRKHTWATADLGEALEVLARHSGLNAEAPESTPPPHPLLADGAALDRWLAATARRLGFEAEPAETPYTEVEATLTAAAPALVRLHLEDETRFLALVHGGRRHVVALGPDHRRHRLAPALIRAALCERLEAPVREEIGALLDEAGVAPKPTTTAAMLRERLGSRPIRGFHLLRLPPDAPFGSQLRHGGLLARLLGLVAAHTAQYVFWLLSWWLIGLAALQGRLDTGWLIAWALLLGTLIPLRLLVTWWQGYLAIHAGAMLKRRLLFGALRLRLEEVRQQGIGQLLGRVIESGAVESLALSGGFISLVAVIELALSAGVLALGAGGGWLGLMLIAWTALTGVLGWRYFHRRASWTHTRLDLTHRLVERMVGHRTRLAQHDRTRWHAGEDQEIERYLDASRTMDEADVVLSALIPRGWLVVGFAALTPAFVAGSSPAALAVALGGLLLGYRAFRRLAMGIDHLAGAAIAWREVSDLFHAATRTEGREAPAQARLALTERHTPGPGDAVLEAHDLSFRYPGGEPVLHRASFHIHAGDRLLLEGPSGSGKSTLAALLTGLRTPDGGLLLLDGLDRHTLGPDGWRDRVVSAPQFHENHVLTGTFAFNLLMGRRWPPTEADLREADALCHDLGLGPLLARMPAGLNQMVGETGWQLSHGEKSRLFLARALLQHADLVLLDESFGALDPENLTLALRTVLRRVPTLVTIAHP